MPLSRVDDVFTLQRTGYSYFGFAAQYVGRSDATFFRYLAGPLVARPLGAPGGGPQPQGPEVPPSRGETRSN